MSKTKHTPGPWTPMVRPPASRADHGWRALAQVWGGWIVAVPRRLVGRLARDAEANARLISAAPDMLAVLRMVDALGLMEFPDGPDDPRTIAEIAPDWLDMWRAARAAIAKATGEND